MTESTHGVAVPIARAAHQLNVPAGWYLQQLRRRALPGHKFGRKWRLTQSDIQGAVDLHNRGAVTLPNRERSNSNDSDLSGKAT